jgi:hypothetical protein
MLTDKAGTLKVRRDGRGRWLISLPGSRPDPIDSVVVARIAGPPDIDPLVVEPKSGETVVLDYLTASTRGRAVKRFNRKGEEGEFHISKMEGPEDAIEWHVKMADPGAYDVSITYAARPGWEDGRYTVSAGKGRITGPVRSSPGWYEYKTEKIGRIEVAKKGRLLVRLHPEHRLDHYLMYFKSLELTPIGL